jgi:hypothetical protein
MKIVKELKEQYAYVWWWLLNQGTFVATLIVNTFLFLVWLFFMVIFYFVMKWLKGH